MNKKSKRVQEKCGFRYHHTLENVPCALPGVLRTEHVTCITREQWLEGKMMNGKNPDPNVIHPIVGYDREIYVKPTITNPNIIVGDFTYIADSEFESHVTHHYEWNGDKLIIGKFCQIAAGVEFVMNGANHQMNAVSTFPFYTLEGWNMNPPAPSDLPIKGDTIIGNDVWIGQNSVILPGPAFTSEMEPSLEQIVLWAVMFYLIPLWSEIRQKYSGNGLMMS